MKTKFKVGDFITASCRIIYPTFVIEEGDRGIIMDFLSPTHAAVIWDKKKNCEYVLNIKRKQIKSYFEYMPERLFEI